MPFASTTKAKICMLLELPVTSAAYVGYVEGALNDAYAQLGETAVTQIEGFITQYEAAQTALNAESANSGLIRADVLEWSAGGKAKGYQNEMNRLKGQISKVLYLDHLIGRSNRVAILRG